MKIYIDGFTWENGSKNDNIRKVLKKHGISYYNTMSSDIYTADQKKVTAEPTGEKDKYNVFIEY